MRVHQSANKMNCPATATKLRLKRSLLQAGSSVDCLVLSHALRASTKPARPAAIIPMKTTIPGVIDFISILSVCPGDLYYEHSIPSVRQHATSLLRVRCTSDKS